MGAGRDSRTEHGRTWDQLAILRGERYAQTPMEMLRVPGIREYELYESRGKPARPGRQQGDAEW